MTAMAIVFVAFGVLIALSGASDVPGGGIENPIAFIFGIGMVIFGIVVFFLGRSQQKQEKAALEAKRHAELVDAMRKRE